MTEQQNQQPQGQGVQPKFLVAQYQQLASQLTIENTMLKAYAAQLEEELRSKEESAPAPVEK